MLPVRDILNFPDPVGEMLLTEDPFPPVSTIVSYMHPPLLIVTPVPNLSSELAATKICAAPQLWAEAKDVIFVSRMGTTGYQTEGSRAAQSLVITIFEISDPPRRQRVEIAPGTVVEIFTDVPEHRNAPG
jgi:hypothetical protein